MSQYTWTYVGGGGKNYRVTLFHGKRTGHVLILLNRQVVQVDFSVRESKTYSFFIEDEFCELRLERRGKEMFYFFEINQEVDTPRNKKRKQLKRKHLGQSFLFFTFLIILASSLALSLRSYNRKLEEERMAREVYRDSTVGLVRLDTLYPTSITFLYVVGNATYSNYFFEDEARGDSLPLFPLVDGDEFTVLYHPRRPDMGRIWFSKPTDLQIRKYKEKSLSRHIQCHPDAHPDMARCTIEVALEVRGLYGLADIYYQQETIVDSPVHNRDSYYRLVRDPEFQRALSERCWD